MPFKLVTRKATKAEKAAWAFRPKTMPERTPFCDWPHPTWVTLAVNPDSREYLMVGGGASREESLELSTERMERLGGEAEVLRQLSAKAGLLPTHPLSARRHAGAGATHP